MNLPHNRTFAMLLALVAGIALAVALAPAAGAKNKGGKPRGIDVSRFQGLGIEWGKVKDDGIEFAFLQASRGNGKDCPVAPDRCGKDETYDRNYRRAKKQGIRVGPYHRAFTNGKNKNKTKADAKDEAKIFLNEVGKLKKGDLLPVLDVETPFDGMSPKNLTIWLKTWLGRVQSKLGAKPIIYTNNSSWQAVGNTTSFARRGHRLWVANFGVKKPLVPAGNWNGEGWSVWQYTSMGHVKGISGDVDQNKLRVPFKKISK